jgi:hypothetical protein
VHDRLHEASEKFRKAVDQQVDLLELRSEHHEGLKTDISVLSTKIRTKIKDVKFAPPISFAGEPPESRADHTQGARKELIASDQKLALKELETLKE